MSLQFTSKNLGVKRCCGNSFHCRSVYLINESKQLFVANHTTPLQAEIGSSNVFDNINLVLGYTNQLVENNGAYFKLHGQHNDPFEFLLWMQKSGYTFERDCRKLKIKDRPFGCIDVHGNLREISAMFSYRFYDSEALSRWIALAMKVDAGSQVLNDCMSGHQY